MAKLIDLFKGGLQIVLACRSSGCLRTRPTSSMANENADVFVPDQLPFRELSEEQLRSLAAKWVEQRRFDLYESELRPLHASVARLEGTEEGTIALDKAVASGQQTFLSSLLKTEHSLQCDLRRRLERERSELEDERQKLRSLRRKQNFEEAKLAVCEDAQERDAAGL